MGHSVANALQYGLWALAVILQIAASVLMFKTKLHRWHSAFFAYLVVQSFREMGLFAILRLKHGPLAYRAYFDFYWATEAICLILSLLVVVNISKFFFRDYRLLHTAVTVLLLLGLVALLALDLFLNADAPGRETNRLISFILLLSRSLGVIQVGLIFGLFLFSHVTGVPLRKDFSFGISLGLSIIAVADLVAAWLRVQLGPIANILYSFSLRFAYLLAVLIWLVYIRAPRKETAGVETEQVSMDVTNWNDALRGFFQQ